ncbi:MAG: hypothetical protein U0R19_22840 [Bryobacteraceae bacterium]
MPSTVEAADRDGGIGEDCIAANVPDPTDQFCLSRSVESFDPNEDDSGTAHGAAAAY